MSDDVRGDRSAGSDADILDDLVDKNELRQRYYGLLQELRVVLPGVQVLMAFLLTAPFASRFIELDEAGRAAYLVALVSTLGSIVSLLGPTVFHRVAERTARSVRMRWGIRLEIAGLLLLAVALTSASWCITRLIYGTLTASIIAGFALVAFVGVWVVLPLMFGRRD